MVLFWRKRSKHLKWEHQGVRGLDKEVTGDYAEQISSPTLSTPIIKWSCIEKLGEARKQA